MAGVTLPSMPGMPPDPGANASPEALRSYDREMQKYAEDMQRYNRVLTQITQMQAEASTTRANMDKAKHDALMAVISNIK